MARILSFILVTALIFLAVIWLVPLNWVLTARGYSSQEIIAMQATNQPQPDPVCEPRAAQQSASDGADYSPSGYDLSGDPQALDSAPETAAASKPAPAHKIVATAIVNVREGAGTDTPVVGQFQPQEVVTVVEDPDGDWLKVKGDRVTGWVYRPLFDKR